MLSNGATQETTPEVLEKLGAVITILNNGTGEINDRSWIGAPLDDGK